VSISVAQAEQFFLAFTRIMAAIIHIPVLGGQTIPNQVRIGLGILLTLFLIPWQTLPPTAATIGVFAFIIAIGKEILIGTLAGFAADLVFGAVQVASETMGLGSGFSSSRIFNPAMGEAGSAFNQLFVLTATMYFLAIDGHHLVLIALQKMFQVIPIQGTIPFSDPTILLQMTSQMIQAGIQLALPILAALLLTDLSLGLLARITPQIQVYFLGLPLKLGISLAGMGLVIVMVTPLLANLYKDLGSKMLMLLEK
jgi:flagellar biosynthetic protein FliR